MAYNHYVWDIWMNVLVLYVVVMPIKHLQRWSRNVYIVYSYYSAFKLDGW